MLALALLLQSCAATRSEPRMRSDEAAANRTLIVVRRGWHIDVGFGHSQVKAPLDSIAASFSGSQYVLFGFGDKHYLVAKHKSFPQMLGALWPGEAIMLVTSLRESPEEAFSAPADAHDEAVVRIQVSAASAQAAQDFIWKSFFSEGSEPTVYAAGPYPESAFYLSSFRYSAFHTCNTWAAEVLRAAGLPIHSEGVLFAGQLWSQVRRIAAAQRRQISARMSQEATFAPP
jgi:hypothetical protein